MRSILVFPAVALLLAGCGGVSMTGIGDRETGDHVVSETSVLGGAYVIDAHVRNDTDADCTYAARVKAGPVQVALVSRTVAPRSSASEAIPLPLLVPGLYTVQMSSGCPWEMAVRPAA